MGGSSAIVAVLVSLHLSKVTVLQNAADAALAQSIELKFQQGNFMSRYCGSAASIADQLPMMSETVELCARVASTRNLTSESVPFVQFLVNISVGNLGEEYDSFSMYSELTGLFPVDNKLELLNSERSDIEKWGTPIPGNLNQIPPLPLVIELTGGSVIDANISRLYSMGFDQLIDDYHEVALRHAQTYLAFQEINRTAESVLSKNYYIFLRILAICLIAIIFPVRVFKSIYEIKIRPV